MRVFESLDDFKAAKGELLGPSEWITVTQDQINGFAESTTTTNGFTPILSWRRPGRSERRSRTAT